MARQCQKTSCGRIPISDLGSGTYAGFTAGLYEPGVNHRPRQHEQIGRALAAMIEPLDAAGAPSQGGLIGFAAIGFSDTSIIAKAFIDDVLPNFAHKNPLVSVVNCAQNGQDAEDLANPGAAIWQVTVPAQLAAAGVDPKQVQVIWLQSGQRQPGVAFPTHAQVMQANLVLGLQNAKTFFPNLKIAYVGTVGYGGYGDPATTPPEPFEYEEAFAIRWLVDQQIQGDPALECRPWGVLPAVAPWIAWGPYFWCDGTTPRSDGLTWVCPHDVQIDGHHPSPIGGRKLAELLLKQLITDPTSRGWWLANPPGAGLPVPPSITGALAP